MQMEACARNLITVSRSKTEEFLWLRTIVLNELFTCSSRSKSFSSWQHRHFLRDGADINPPATTTYTYTRRQKQFAMDGNVEFEARSITIKEDL